MAETEEDTEKQAEQTRKETEEAVKRNEQNNPNLVEEAKKVNEEKARLIEEEKKLMDRKEKLHAEQLVGGGSQAGQLSAEESKEAKKITQSKEFFKNTALGDAINKTNE